MIRITDEIAIQDDEVELVAIRAQGAGGQNVNKVASAVHLRFPIGGSSLPDAVKERLLGSRDQRISGDGVLVLKAQRFRTLEKNREDALERLAAIVGVAARERTPRLPSRPTRSSQRRRVELKVRRGRVKALRGRVDEGE